MARNPREHFQGAFYHVCARGNGGEPVLAIQADHDAFFEIVKETKRIWPFAIFAYCLMTNHLHMLLRVADASLSFLMQRILTGYSLDFNKRHKRRGHVFQSRYGRRSVVNDGQFLTVLRYIHRNPVRAGLVDSPGSWPGSGHREMLGLDDHGLLERDFILGLFADRQGEGLAAYVDFIGLPEPTIEIPKEEDLLPIRFRSENAEQVLVPRVGLSDLAARISQDSGMAVEAIQGPARVREVVEQRKRFVRKAAELGHCWSDIARFLGRSRSGVYQLARDVT